MKVASHTALEEALSAMIGDLTNLVIQYHPFCWEETHHQFLDVALYGKDFVFGVQRDGEVLANSKIIGNIKDYTNTNGVVSIEIISIPSGFVIAIRFRKYSVFQMWTRNGFQRHTCLGYSIEDLFYYNQALYFRSRDTIRRFHLQTHQVIVIHRDSNAKEFICLPNKEILVMTTNGKVYRKGRELQWIKTQKPIHSLRLSKDMVFFNGNEFVYDPKTNSVKEYGLPDYILQTGKWRNVILIATETDVSFWCSNVYAKYDPIDDVVTTPLRCMLSFSCGKVWCGKSKIVVANTDTLIHLK